MKHSQIETNYQRQPYSNNFVNIQNFEQSNCQNQSCKFKNQRQSFNNKNAHQSNINININIKKQNLQFLQIFYLYYPIHQFICSLPNQQNQNLCIDFHSIFTKIIQSYKINQNQLSHTYSLSQSLQLPSKITIENRTLKQQKKNLLLNVFNGRSIKKQKCKNLLKQFLIKLKELALSLNLNNDFNGNKVSYQKQNYNLAQKVIKKNIPLLLQIKTVNKNHYQSKPKSKLKLHSLLTTFYQVQEIIKSGILDQVNHQKICKIKLNLQLFSSLLDEIQKCKQLFEAFIKNLSQIQRKKYQNNFCDNFIKYNDVNIKIQSNNKSKSLLKKKQPQRPKTANQNKQYISSKFIKKEQKQKIKQFDKQIQKKVGFSSTQVKDNQKEQNQDQVYHVHIQQRQSENQSYFTQTKTTTFTRPSSTKYHSRQASLCGQKNYLKNLNTNINNQMFQKASIMKRNRNYQLKSAKVRGKQIDSININNQSKNLSNQNLLSLVESSKMERKSVRLLSAKFRPLQDKSSYAYQVQGPFLSKKSSRKNTIRRQTVKFSQFKINYQELRISQDNNLKFNEMIKNLKIEGRSKSKKQQDENLSKNSKSQKDLKQQERYIFNINTKQFEPSRYRKQIMKGKLRKNTYQISKFKKRKSERKQTQSNTIIMRQKEQNQSVESNNIEKEKSIKSYESQEKCGQLQKFIFNPMQIVQMKRNSRINNSFVASRALISKQEKQLQQIGRQAKRKSRFTKVIFKDEHQRRRTNQNYNKKRTGFQQPQENVSILEIEDTQDAQNQLEKQRKNSIITQTFKSKRRNAVKKKSGFFQQKRKAFQKKTLNIIDQDLMEIQKQRLSQQLRTSANKNKKAFTYTPQKENNEAREIKKKKFTSPLKRYYFQSRDLCSLEQIEYDQIDYYNGINSLKKTHGANDFQNRQLENEKISPKKYNVNSIPHSSPYQYLKNFRQNFNSKKYENHSYQTLPTFFLRQQLQQNFKKHQLNELNQQINLTKKKSKNNQNQMQVKTIQLQTEQTFNRLQDDKKSERFEYFLFDSKWIAQKRQTFYGKGKQFFSGLKLSTLDDFKQNLNSTNSISLVKQKDIFCQKQYGVQFNRNQKNNNDSFYQI